MVWAYSLSWRITGVCFCKGAVAHMPKQIQIIWKSASPQWVQSWKSLISASARLVLLQDLCRGEGPWEHVDTPGCAARELSVFSCDALQRVCTARGSGSRHCQLSGWRTRFWFPVANCRVSLQKKILLLCIVPGFLGAADIVTSLILPCLFQKFSRYFRNGHQKKQLL